MKAAGGYTAALTERLGLMLSEEMEWRKEGNFKSGLYRMLMDSTGLMPDYLAWMVEIRANRRPISL